MTEGYPAGVMTTLSLPGSGAPEDGDGHGAARAVRRLLDDLRRGGDGGLAELDTRILATHDPIVRMDLVERRRRVAQQRRLIEEDFVRLAGVWAAAEGVRRAAFEAEGVPSDLLDRAGLVP
jgi:hypothetical protein